MILAVVAPHLVKGGCFATLRIAGDLVLSAWFKSEDAGWRAIWGHVVTRFGRDAIAEQGRA